MHQGDPDATLLKKLLTYFGKYVHRATAEEALKIVTGKFYLPPSISSTILSLKSSPLYVTIINVYFHLQTYI